MEVKIAPSILSADFACLGRQVREAAEGGADWIHIDVMDGHFVPPITIGALVVERIRPYASIPFDVHLMVEEPERHVEDFAKAGADIITVHLEASLHLHRTIMRIKELGKRAGVALNPSTSASLIEEILPAVDLVLVMTVNPGYAGQRFIAEMEGKIRKVRRMLDERGLRAELEVDGGITPDTAPIAVRSGATVLVAGAAVFASGRPIAEAISALRKSIERRGYGDAPCGEER